VLPLSAARVGIAATSAAANAATPPSLSIYVLQDQINIDEVCNLEVFVKRIIPRAPYSARKKSRRS
jgi:hypothetical protein